MLEQLNLKIPVIQQTRLLTTILHESFFLLEKEILVLLFGQLPQPRQMNRMINILSCLLASEAFCRQIDIKWFKII